MPFDDSMFSFTSLAKDKTKGKLKRNSQINHSIKLTVLHEQETKLNDCSSSTTTARERQTPAWLGNCECDDYSLAIE